MEMDGIGSYSGEGIEGGGGGEREEVEGKLRKQEEEGLRTLGVVVACLFLESIAATKAAAQLLCGFACFHTATTTRLVLLQ
jgi:hypothetical protein